MDQVANFAPYAAPENVTRILLRLRKSGLRRMDAEFLTQLAIGEGMINRTLRAMEFLGYIQSDGTPTPVLERFVVAGEDEWQGEAQATLRNAYAKIFGAVDPSTDDRVKVQNAFRPMNPQGQWGRMVTLFLGLCQWAGIEVKDPPTQRPGRGESKSESTPRRPKNPTKNNGQPAADSIEKKMLSLPPAPPKPPLDPALAAVVGKISELETADDLESWIRMFRVTFGFVKKIRVEDPV